ncbi:uncharacterized protein LOC129969143 [Argiope bruennichi]|uniref:uncharacterized protein LOC129969143 n=1 Tax=Argiope bruennichi TaxID=94029 RepID=UPI0024954704|nr:uncharacterized protein LOC129969143 [Argiope bruennichi]
MGLKLFLLPSLVHLAIVKISVALYYNSRISALIDELEIVDEAPRMSANRRIRQKWAQIEKKVEKEMHQYLPTSLARKVARSLRAIHSEVKDWIEDHEVFLRSVNEDYKSILIWKSEGTIDRPRTAEEWVRGGTMDIHKCFLLACTYFLESDILNLWAKMKVHDKRKLFTENANLAVRFWTDWIREGAIPSTWFQIANESLDTENIWPNDYRIRVSAFFDRIDWLVSSDYFENCHVVDKIHRDDLRSCINRIEWRKQISAIHFERKVYSTYLDWPLQNVFPKLIDEIRYIPYVLNEHTVRWIITYILKKIQAGWKDADYFKILREFWDCVRFSVKEVIKEAKIYKPLMIALNYTKPQLYPIEKILDRYLVP